MALSYFLNDDPLPIPSPHGMGHKKVVHRDAGTRTLRISMRTGRVATRPRVAHAPDFPIGLHFVPVARIPRRYNIGIAIRDLAGGGQSPKS